MTTPRILHGFALALALALDPASAFSETELDVEKNDYQWDIETGEVYLQSQKYVPYAFSSNDSRIRPAPAIGKTLFLGYRWRPELELRFGGLVPIRQEVVAVRSSSSAVPGASTEVEDTFEFSKAISGGIAKRFSVIPMTAKGWVELWGASSAIVPIARGLKYYLIPTVEAGLRVSFRDGAGIGIGFGYGGIVSTGTAFAKLGVSKRF